MSDQQAPPCDCVLHDDGGLVQRIDGCRRDHYVRPDAVQGATADPLPADGDSKKEQEIRRDGKA